MLFKESENSKRERICINLAFLTAVLVIIVDIGWLRYNGFDNYSKKAVFNDFWFVLYLFSMVLFFQKRVYLGFLAVFTIFYFIYFVGFLKYEVFGEPPRISDLFNLGGLFIAVKWEYIVLALSPIVVPLIFIILNWRFSIFGTVLALIGCFVLLGSYGLINSKIDRGQSKWYSYTKPAPVRLGHLAAFAYDALSYASRISRMREKVYSSTPKDADLKYRLFLDRQIGQVPLRDVHIIVVESFVDPALIEGYSFSPNPLSKNISTLLENQSRRAFAPVKGGRSPDAEFEILCGLAALLDWRDVVFNALTSRTLDCLPEKMTGAGWHTVATNPIPPYFFNSKRVYKNIGFEETYFSDSLDMTDKDGNYLSAMSTLDQHLDHVRQDRASGKPVFTYVFPPSSHTPFPRNKKLRPDRIVVSPENAIVERYINALHYSVAAVDLYRDRVLAENPHALVIIIGDHTPYLGPDVEFSNGLNSNGISDFEVPLLIYDGAETVISPGLVSQYEIPNLIVSLLTGDDYCKAHRCGHEKKIRMRPLVVGGYAFNSDGSESQFCDVDDREYIKNETCNNIWQEKSWHTRKMLQLVQ